MVNNQPIKPTEETNLDSMMKFMMKQFGQMNKERRQDKEELNKKLELLQIGVNKKLDQISEELKKQMEAVSYTHLPN